MAFQYFWLAQHAVPASLLPSILNIIVVGVLQALIIVVLISIERVVQLLGQVRLKGLVEVGRHLLLQRLHGHQVLDDVGVRVLRPRHMPPALADLQAHRRASIISQAMCCCAVVLLWQHIAARMMWE